jgi:hypothetical protein
MIAVDVSLFYCDEDQYWFEWCKNKWGLDKSVWQWDSSIVRGVNQYLFDTAEKANAFREQWEPK